MGVEESTQYGHLCKSVPDLFYGLKFRLSSIHKTKKLPAWLVQLDFEKCSVL